MGGVTHRRRGSFPKKEVCEPNSEALTLANGGTSVVGARIEALKAPIGGHGGGGVSPSPLVCEIFRKKSMLDLK